MPVHRDLNDYAGAYVWFKKVGTALGLESSFISAFFSDTMGVTTTTYYWGFRAPTRPTTTARSTTYDFVRLQLYRDLSVYEEVGRRAAIVCGGGTVTGYLSAAEYITAAGGRRRRLTDSEEPASYQEHYDIIKDATNGRLSHEREPPRVAACSTRRRTARSRPSARRPRPTASSSTPLRRRRRRPLNRDGDTASPLLTDPVRAAALLVVCTPRLAPSPPPHLALLSIRPRPAVDRCVSVVYTGAPPRYPHDTPLPLFALRRKSATSLY